MHLWPKKQDPTFLFSGTKALEGDSRVLPPSFFREEVLLLARMRTPLPISKERFHRLIASKAGLNERFIKLCEIGTSQLWAIEGVKQLD